MLSILHLSSNGDLDLNTSLDVDDDLLDNLSWCVQTTQNISLHSPLISLRICSLNQSLVDSHLKAIPGLGTLSAGCLSGSNLQGLGWETDWALDAEVLGLGTVDELLADLLERLDLSGGEGDADLVGFLLRKKVNHPSQVQQQPGHTGVAMEGGEHILGPRRRSLSPCCKTF